MSDICLQTNRLRHEELHEKKIRSINNQYSLPLLQELLEPG